MKWHFILIEERRRYISAFLKFNFIFCKCITHLMVISLRVNFDLRIFLHFLLVCNKKNFNLQNIFHKNLNCSLGKDIADNFYFIYKIQIALLTRSLQIFLFYYSNWNFHLGAMVRRVIVLPVQSCGEWGDPNHWLWGIAWSGCKYRQRCPTYCGKSSIGRSTTNILQKDSFYQSP